MTAAEEASAVRKAAKRGRAAVSGHGRRAYAIAAKGGLWYTEDAGTTWRPVGGWGGGVVSPGGTGNVFSGGALLVQSGDDASNDAVLDYVRPVRNDGGLWAVFAEPCTVEVLPHDRDSRIVPAGQAFAVLLWRAAPTLSAQLATPAGGLDACRDAVLPVGAGGRAPSGPRLGVRIVALRGRV